LGDKPNDFEVILSTNTLITNCLEAKLITTSNGMPPVITYNQNSATPFPAPDGASIQMMNKVGIVGLGHVLSSEEVVSGHNGNGVRLKSIVAHNDWDSQVSLCCLLV
jgi:hypothetical protein